MKIAVLGHRGMLGHVVSRYLKEIGHEVLTTDERYDYVSKSDERFFDDISRIDPNIIINCIGLIKQKVDNYNNNNCRLLELNSVLPLHLCTKFPNTVIIHPSTDCIFSGLEKVNGFERIPNKGRYYIDDIPDPTDMYGISKALGEIISKYPLAYIIRCSIIGPELDTKYGLLEWFLSQDGTAHGYTNHKWNGITTLEWAKYASEMLLKIIGEKNKEDRLCSKIVQPCSSSVHSKAEILHMISDIWKKDIKIIDIPSDTAIDRSLISNISIVWKRNSLYDQLQELYNWYYK